MAFWNQTRWSLVQLAAREDGPNSSRALNALASAYYQPVQRSFEDLKVSPETAEDLTQVLMSQVFSAKGMAKVIQIGRLRDYLRGAIRHAVAGHWRHQYRACRDVRLKCDMEAAEHVLASSTDTEILSDTSLAVLCAEKAKASVFAQCPFPETFELFWPHVIDMAVSSQVKLAADCGLSAPVVRQRICQLRRQYDSAFRQEVQRLVIDPAELEDEVLHLKNLSRAMPTGPLVC
jgi:DNA-directed RNA polymerase specialized sigma24 family protein